MKKFDPPLNPLKTFETTARCRSFSAAADALNVTPSAVSKQIKVLEEYLGASLFERGSNGARLTTIGNEYFSKIASAFNQISLATEDIQKFVSSKPFYIRVPYTFGDKFLIPLLNNFRIIHPGINIQIVAGIERMDFSRSRVDLSIQNDVEDEFQNSSKRLFPTWRQPVCSPKMLRERGDIRDLDDMKRYPLLFSRYFPRQWDAWFAAVGRPDITVEAFEHIELPSSAMAYQGAVQGLGLALGQLPILSRDIEEKRLTGLFDLIRDSDYYAVWNPELGPSAKVRLILKWLEIQIQREYAGLIVDLERRPGRPAHE
ncbi:MAG: LysR family transcriptional regulator [Microvirga sp.]|nr:LysR family transcriptional regulator [Microvirga sp.]